jgi:hypothetical protein
MKYSEKINITFLDKNHTKFALYFKNILSHKKYIDFNLPKILKCNLDNYSLDFIIENILKEYLLEEHKNSKQVGVNPIEKESVFSLYHKTIEMKSIDDKIKNLKKFLSNKNIKDKQKKLSKIKELVHTKNFNALVLLFELEDQNEIKNLKKIFNQNLNDFNAILDDKKSLKIIQSFCLEESGSGYFFENIFKKIIIYKEKLKYEQIVYPQNVKKLEPDVVIIDNEKIFIIDLKLKESIFDDDSDVYKSLLYAILSEGYYEKVYPDSQYKRYNMILYPFPSDNINDIKIRKIYKFNNNSKELLLLSIMIPSILILKIQHNTLSTLNDFIKKEDQFIKNNAITIDFHPKNTLLNNK